MPVSSMMRFDRFPGQQQSAKKPTNKKAVFAAVLLSAESALEAAELQDVRARA